MKTAEFDPIVPFTLPETLDGLVDQKRLSWDAKWWKLMAQLYASEPPQTEKPRPQMRNGNSYSATAWA